MIQIVRGQVDSVSMPNKHSSTHSELLQVMNPIYVLLIVILLNIQANFADQVEFEPAQPMPSAPLDRQSTISRIAVGSCAQTNKDQTIFNTIRAQKPDIFLYIGDNVYAATEKDDPRLSSLKQAYHLLAQSEAFQQLRKQVPVLPTWDDHDFGLNDAGGDWPHKAQSEALFEYVWAIPEQAPSRLRKGIYHSQLIGEENTQVQIIVLDTRFFRTPLFLLPEPHIHGRYTPSTAPDQSLLGEDQWSWLAAQLTIPAQLRIIVSSIQFLAEGHHWESWRLLPQERSRLFALLRGKQVNNAIVVSGDRHLAALYKDEASLNFPLWELTTSSLNVPLSSFKTDIQLEPGPNRVGLPFYDANFAMIEIDWEQAKLELQIRNAQNEVVRQTQLLLKLPGMESH
jgi:alkaline phosphatase D